MSEERLQKVLAQAGVASRRACEALILAGRVTVNGQVVDILGSKVDPRRSRIEVDGIRVGRQEKTEYILLFKPAGYITTVSDERRRRTVMDLLPQLDVRVYPVGRLDYDTTGLLLLTNDGPLAHSLTHPSRGVGKTYQALVQGIPSLEELNRLRRGLILEDGLTAPAKVVLLREDKGNALLEITIHEGRNRQVKRMVEKVGHPVLHLKRTSFGPLQLGRMQPGDWRYLTPEEIASLKKIDTDKGV